MMTSINIKDMKITAIQFFDGTHEIPVQSSENELETFTETFREYSANIVFDDKLIIQLSGNDEEAHKPSIPKSVQQYWNDEEFQDLAYEELDIDDVINRLEELDIENNFNFLQENATERY